MPATRLTKEQIEELRRLARNGESIASLANRFDLLPESVKRWTDDEYRERRNQIVRADRLRRLAGKAPSRLTQATRTAKWDEVAALMDEIPEDTRDLTGRLLGDPIPGDPRRPWVPKARTPERNPMADVA